MTNDRPRGFQRQLLQTGVVSSQLVQLGLITGQDNSVKSQINSALGPCEAVLRGILFIIYACL